MMNLRAVTSYRIVPSRFAGLGFAPNTLLFQVALVLATISITLGTIRWWRKLRIAPRVLAVVLVEVLVVLSVMTAVNRINDLATTWSSMIGSTSNLAPAVISQSDGAGSFGGGDNMWHRTRQGRAVDRSTALRSTLTSIMIGGGQTGYDLAAQIYLPGSYYSRSSTTRTYPVLELLAGYPGSYLSWSTALFVKHTLDSLIRRGKMPAVIAVMPSQNPYPPADSECVDVDRSVGDGSRAESYLTDDVRTYLTLHYRAATGRRNWVIGGYSTGGYCAANLGLRHPDLYGSVIALSGYFAARQDGTTGRLFKNRKEFDANSPQLTIARPHPKMAFFTICADDNAEDTRASRRFVEAIPANDAHLSMLTRTGGHTPTVWRVGSRFAFIWLAHLLSR